MSTDARHTADAAQPPHTWLTWQERRAKTLTAPYGPLSLTGTHWLDDHPGGRLPGIGGRWRAEGDAVVLTAAPQDGITLEGVPVDGEVRLTAHQGPVPDAPLALGGRRLVVLRREGLWAVRDFDPDAPARVTFPGIAVGDYDPQWALPGRFRPYPDQRSVRVANADGRERGLGLHGEIVFTVAGEEHTLAVAVEEDGSLWAVFADGLRDQGGYPFRFLRPPAPAADSTVTVDFNRALLPPCAFADHFICPFPPPGNTLPFAVPTGERAVRAD
ncbi:DUF1684 domain-containing protein [Streptomyces sp. NPDC000594]|uniref:DUF1684 domain-containing protein n=1 Tax=Streptomyces sp. NPDC000594 TaxID=3154261 RepID=UPI00331DB7CC